MRDLPSILFTEWDTYSPRRRGRVPDGPGCPRNPKLQGHTQPFNLDWFLSQYGVRVNRDMVFDIRSHESLTVPDVFAPIIVPYPYWVRIPQADARVSGE